MPRFRSGGRSHFWQHAAPCRRAQVHDVSYLNLISPKHSQIPHEPAEVRPCLQRAGVVRCRDLVSAHRPQRRGCVVRPDGCTWQPCCPGPVLDTELPYEPGDTSVDCLLIIGTHDETDRSIALAQNVGARARGLTPRDCDVTRARAVAIIYRRRRGKAWHSLAHSTESEVNRLW
jgi:hypothetical protein